MLGIYEFFDACKESRLSGEEALKELQTALDEHHADLIDELEERSCRTAYQQDLIDLHRFER